MATPKTITAYDVDQRALTLERDGSRMMYERLYWLVDDAGEPLELFGQRRISGAVEIAAIPQNVRDALVLIDAWTYQQALAQEGMAD